MRRAAVYLGFAFAIACGDSDNTGAPPLPGPYKEVFEAVCSAMERCPDFLGRPITYRDQSECASIVRFALGCRLVETEVGDISDFSIEERFADLDEATADACIDWMKSASCEEINRGGEDTPCSRVLAGADPDDDGDVTFGTGQGGDRCYGDSDCASAYYCVDESVDPTTGVQTCAGCVSRKTFGDECAQQDRQCAEGLYCRYERDEPRRCTLLDPNGVECIENEQCESGFCNRTMPEASGWGVCDAGGSDGDPCEEHGDCRNGFFCDGTCQARKTNGASCASSQECKNGYCDEAASRCGKADGTQCYSGSECISRACNDSECGPPMPGGSCGDDEDCPTGYVCTYASDTCQEPLSDGAACRRDEECSSGICNFDDRCAAPPQAGSTCDDTSDCGPLAFCSNGSCTPRLSPGDSCTALDSCLEPFLCMNGTCELINLACRPAPAGEQCALLRVCDDESWCDFFDNFTCKPKGAEGEDCQPTQLWRLGIEVCREGLRCGDDNTCVPKSRSGQPCGSSRECVDDTFCVGGTCREGPEGRPCDDYDAPCPAGLFCGDNETCRSPGGSGAQCSEIYQCQPGLFCKYGMCTERLGMGEDCRDAEECREPLHCGRSTYVCEEDLTADMPCDYRYDECATGLYCPRGESNPVCTVQVAAGEDCDRSEECQSGVCYSSDFCLANAVCTPPE